MQITSANGTLPNLFPFRKQSHSGLGSLVQLRGSSTPEAKGRVANCLPIRVGTHSLVWRSFQGHQSHASSHEIYANSQPMCLTVLYAEVLWVGGFSSRSKAKKEDQGFPFSESALAWQLSTRATLACVFLFLLMLNTLYRPGLLRVCRA